MTSFSLPLPSFYKEDFVRINWNSLKAEMTNKKKNPAKKKIIKPSR